MPSQLDAEKVNSRLFFTTKRLYRAERVRVAGQTGNLVAGPDRMEVVDGVAGITRHQVDRQQHRPCAAPIEACGVPHPIARIAVEREPVVGVVEQCFNNTKRWRGEVTRSDKLSCSTAAAQLRAMSLWLKHFGDML
ncbi:hypothetical protein [Mycobacterium sp. AZCC_0083]|uniref:hypothetical protein n=1 Tax=Mycobacterium sp. AZCC_0083 TaxID=2735882 RepID=UPI001616ED7E|nr:hypothetical protein [Mycobacterium sp. AZCC_0083]MBB5167541.1 hypothetical protein [Mycobacterium sp. AZCC_0083]